MKKIMILIFMSFLSMILLGCDKLEKGFAPKDELSKYELDGLIKYFTFTDDFCHDDSSENRLCIYFNYNDDSDIIQLSFNINDYLHNKTLFSYCGYPGEIKMMGMISDAYNSDEFVDYVERGIYEDEENKYKIGSGGFSVNFIYQPADSDNIYHLEICTVNKTYNDKRYSVGLTTRKINNVSLWEYGKDDYYDRCNYYFTKEEFLNFYEEYKKQNDNLLFFGLDNSNYYAQVQYRFTADKIYKEAYDNKIYDYKYIDPSVTTNFIYRDYQGKEKYKIMFSSLLHLTSDMFDDLSNLDYSYSKVTYPSNEPAFDIYANGVFIGYAVIFKNDDNLSTDELNNSDFDSDVISRFLTYLTN